MDGTLRFGHFELRPPLRELRVHGHQVPLGSRAFDLLLALAERRDRLVTKDELLEIVWPGLVVEENNLQVQVSALRKLLGAKVITTVPGRGYRFTAVAEEPQPLSVAPAPVPVDAGTAQGLGYRLLVADDNKVNRLLLTRSLDLMGHRVTSVDNGRRALNMLRAERFDLLLLDLEMPELDGFALLEAMANDAALAEVPVIITSSVEGVAPVARCIELGADDFLHKPVDPTLLKARVVASLEKRRMREQQRELIGRLTALLAVSGEAGPAVPASPRRCRAALLAARLVGLEAWPDGGDAAALVELAEACRTLLADAVAGQDGVPVADAGDELVAAFGLDGSRSSGTGAPIAAFQSAREMAVLIDGLNAERAAAGRPAVRLAVGIAQGEVVAGRGGRPGESRVVCLGAALDEARALALRAADAGRTIVVDATVSLALGGLVRVEPLEPERAYGVVPG
ncbi:response regulator [uncultured Piscinibacter sp.]|uniref:response regulator n=1 Tax=uncultured Piscinibacter sp. TaxID=1131835 RepID=UPI00260B99FF|nr:response regulator [uncultured Piscinibacter sp.]